MIALLFCLSVQLFVLADAPSPSRLSLKQIIAHSRKNTQSDAFLLATNSIKFEPREVRNIFSGTEKDFIREMCDLFRNGDESDRFDVLNLIFHPDIKDESVSRCLRDEFGSIDGPFLQSRMLLAIARDSSDANIDFMLTILKQSTHPPALRIDTANILSESMETDIERQKLILNTLLSYLDDKSEFHVVNDGCSRKFGDEIAFLLGNLGKFAKKALPEIRNKFLSIKDAEDNCNVLNKLRLASAIVRINPVKCNELEYILRKSDDETEAIRWEVIMLLGKIPPALSNITVPHLCEIIQKEKCIANKIIATESIKTILLEQEKEMNNN